SRIAIAITGSVSCIKKGPTLTLNKLILSYKSSGRIRKKARYLAEQAENRIMDDRLNGGEHPSFWLVYRLK
ncbi:MAG: hypothetical protein U1B77_04830, partial [Dehalococcoidales bacterium]|nr:hypothetical protein [Dehalococcoidales bacterium]